MLYSMLPVISQVSYNAGYKIFLVDAFFQILLKFALMRTGIQERYVWFISITFYKKRELVVKNPFWAVIWSTFTFPTFTIIQFQFFFPFYYAIFFLTRFNSINGAIKWNVPTKTLMEKRKHLWLLEWKNKKVAAKTGANGLIWFHHCTLIPPLVPFPTEPYVGITTRAHSLVCLQFTVI